MARADNFVELAWITVSNKKHTSKKRGHCKAEMDCSRTTTAKGKIYSRKIRIAQSKLNSPMVSRIFETLVKKTSFGRSWYPSFDLEQCQEHRCFVFQVTGADFNAATEAPGAILGHSRLESLSLKGTIHRRRRCCNRPLVAGTLPYDVWSA